MFIVGIKSSKKRSYECVAPFYPYAKEDNFTIALKQGKNEIEFETQDHYNSFIHAATGDIMAEEVVLLREQNEADEEAEENRD